MSKKIKIAAAIVLAAFIITNPSLSRFNEFAPSQFNDSKYKVYEDKLQSSRVNNYFVFSVYEVKAMGFINGDGFYQEVDRYYGALGNFYFIHREVRYFKN